MPTDWSNLDANHRTFLAAAERAQIATGVPAGRRQPAQIDVFGPLRYQSDQRNGVLTRMKIVYPLGHIIYVNGERWAAILGHDSRNDRISVQTFEGQLLRPSISELQARDADIEVVTPQEDQVVQSIEQARPRPPVVSPIELALTQSLPDAPVAPVQVRPAREFRRIRPRRDLDGINTP